MKKYIEIPLEARRRIFVRGVNWVGDAIMTTPALQHVRKIFKDSHITMMARPWVAAVYENNPDIDELWIEDDSSSMKHFFQAVQRVRAGKFDFGIVFPNSFRSAALMALGQIKHRIGFARGRRSWLLNRPVKVEAPILRQHQVYYYLGLVQWMSDEPPAVPELVLRPGETERQEVKRLLKEHEIDEAKMLVGIAPGSINSTAKRWLPERFAAVADRLHGEIGAEVLLIGSEKERGVLDRIEALCQSPVCNLGGKASLAKVIALIERLHAFIGNDSGAMHLAAALHVPSVAIFGPTEWETTAPFSSGSKVVRHDVECSPCMLRECPIEHPCMTGIAVDDVLRSFAELAPEIKNRMKGAA